MEGTWGRRIFGTVKRTATLTRFTLMLEMGEGKVIFKDFYASNSDLEKYPDFYKSILDMLTLFIEKDLTSGK